MRHFILLAFCLFLIHSLIWGQQIVDEKPIKINGYQAVNINNSQTWWDSVSTNYKTTQAFQLLFTFQQLPNAAEVLYLQNAGIRLMDFLPPLSFTAYINHPQAINLTQQHIQHLSIVEDNWKLDYRISDLIKSSPEMKHVVLVQIAPFISLNVFEKSISKFGGTLIDTTFHQQGLYEVSVRLNQLKDLTHDAIVRYVGLPAKPQTLNFDARSSTGANLIFASDSLDGRGITIGMGDNTSGIYHIDVRDRLLNFNPAEPAMHGVHTTLTVAGKGILDPRTQGMAPSARVLAHLYDLAWANTASMYQDYNMTLTNNSYASVIGDCSFSGTYDPYAQMLDQYALNFPEVLNVFAAGNDGLMQCGTFPQGFHTVEGGYQPSKNILVVGGMEKDNSLWPKTSRGPVKDGRLKPEIMAYGYQIYSGDVYDNYGKSNGTSMSAPVVTGNLALLSQRYKQKFGNNPPASLLKALMMNGATDMGNPGPDFTYGFGLINTFRSKQMLDSNHFWNGTVNQSANAQTSIFVPPNASQLKVMLYWNDTPSSILASTNLVNNLDLTVTEPSGQLHHPLVLNPLPANVSAVALEGVDSLNNVEQIVVNNPTSGNYTVSVKGTTLLSSKQKFVVVYDIIPTGLKIHFPTTNCTVPGNDSIYVYWDASDNTNTFTLSYSPDNGLSWVVLQNNIPPNQRHFVWYTPNISSGKCLFRVQRNISNEMDLAGPFVLNPAPILQLSPIQCPGYMAINWNAITGISQYEVLLKKGDDLQPVDTVSVTSYVFSGLRYDQLYYAAVRPLINSRSGWRSKGIKRKPFDGNCAGNISDGDLAIDSIISPNSGRQFTSSALGSMDTLSLLIRNLDDVPVNQFSIIYSKDGSAWQSQIFNQSIPANNTLLISIPGQDVSMSGLHYFKAAVKNLSAVDHNPTNDSADKWVKNLTNLPISLQMGFQDDFENLSNIELQRATMGFSPNEHWDYTHSTDSGRLRSFVSNAITIQGIRSLSMDLLLNEPDNVNIITGTFNLQNENINAVEARLDFDFKMHGRPKFETGNDVYIRGSDTSQWLKLYQFDTTSVPGMVYHTGSLSITDAFKKSGQNFSAGFQVRISQHDTSVIAANDYGNGLTLDNFRLYSVKRDVQMIKIISPSSFNCNEDSTAIIVQIYNSDNLPVDTIALFYRLNNGTIVSDTLWHMNSKDTINFTFRQHVPLYIGSYLMDAWLSVRGDTYRSNDSLLVWLFRNQPLVSRFPYLESFETSNGNWFAMGSNNSWQYGTPNSLKIKTAASGNKVWATNLTGNYNNNERSYLYSPCFDLSSLSNPMLSFSLATNIENCGNVLCDGAYMEYSSDGKQWARLGNTGEGFNWYSALNYWTDTNARWHVASIPLPKNLSSIKLRFVFRSDAGTTFDGIAIDDIHIFDLKYPIFKGAMTTDQKAIPAQILTNFTPDNRIISSIFLSQQPNNLKATYYPHTTVFEKQLQQYFLPRNYVLQSSQPIGDSALIRLFVTDQDVLKMLADNTCDTCNRAADVYRLGVLAYENENKDLENGSLVDNISGSYEFISYSGVTWVPYERGYYAQIARKSLSEFWFTDKTPRHFANNFLLFPNPVVDSKINIVWSASPGVAQSITLYDAMGKKVFETTLIATDFDNQTTIILPPLETGIYTARCLSNQTVNRVKLLIIR
ncbi:MAG: S8 family serine peptidase [Bacteroidetes bacterium]|nr:S8 family serine peptidase [Bacteroidota bacterium]